MIANTANTANMNTDTKSGVVKWYNNKTGYGFITCDGSDVFVYHSSIVVDKEQFRYLVEGEYVIFCVEERKGKSVAVNVRGVDGGRLMCETRNSVSRSTSDVSGKNDVADQDDIEGSTFHRVCGTRQCR